MALKFYTSVAKRLKLKVRKILGLITIFVEVTALKGSQWGFFPPPLPKSSINALSFCDKEVENRSFISGLPTSLITCTII